MTRLGTFLTRTAGSQDRADRFGIADFLAYSYLVFGVFIILIPVLWTFFSSIKPERAVDSFDTRVLPMSQVEALVEDIGDEVHTPAEQAGAGGAA